MKYLLLMVMLTSCASSWKRVPVSNEEMVWRSCSENLDGPNVHRKGWCYQATECKDQFIGKKCRNVPLFCAHGDNECFDKWGLHNKVLGPKDQILTLQ